MRPQLRTELLQSSGNRIRLLSRVRPQYPLAMQLVFERGEAQRPKGHALIYFRDSDGAGVLATYVVIPPISIDFSKYLPLAKWTVPVAACLLLVAYNGAVIRTFAAGGSETGPVTSSCSSFTRLLVPERVPRRGCVSRIQAYRRPRRADGGDH